MPTFEYPGVYVEEIGSGVHEIPGVDPPIDDARLQSLVALMRELSPSWANFNESDPGRTLVTLFAWLTEQILYRANEIPQRDREAVRRALAALSMLPSACADRDAPLRRPNFFSGRLLDAATLQDEQDYHRRKLRRQVLALHGCGIVNGLDVRIDESGGGSLRVIVEPGYAIAPNGDEIALPRGVALVVALDGAEGYVSVRPWDHPCPDGTPTTGATSNPRCIEEACVVAVAADLPPHALGVARLRRAESGWTVDTAYEAPRAR